MQTPDVIDINRKSRASISTDPIDVLRGRIFASVIDHLCDANLREAQKSVGVWPWHDSIPVPNRRTFMMFRNGTMNFTIKTALGDVFGIWMFPGEVRIGFRLPPELAPFVHDTVRQALDGEITPCPRIVDMGASGTFFDWIFRDGFAGIDLWIKAINDDIAAVIADTARSIMIHLYMSVIHAVISYAGLNSLSGCSASIKAKVKTATIVINFDCDEAQALSAIEDAELKLMASFAQPGERSIAIVTVNSETPMEFVDNALARLECGFTLKMGA